MTETVALGLDHVLTSSGRIRILTVLSQVEELHLTEIAKRIDQSYSSTERHLRDLAKAAVVEEHDYGRVRMFRLKLGDPKVSLLRELILAWDHGPRGLVAQAQA